jgi:signal transduction histidine kinase
LTDRSPLTLYAPMSADQGDTEIGQVGAIADMARFPEMNPGPVLRMTREGIILLANRVARDLFGGDTLIGTRWTTLCPGMTDDVWNRVLAHEQNVLHETDFDGRCFSFAHVHPSGEQSVFVFGTDITERRRAEQDAAEQAAKVAEVARFPDMNPGPVLRLGLDRCVRLANAAAQNVFGAELVGRDWSDICPGMTEVQWRTIVAAREVVPFEARIGDREYVFAHRRDHDGSLVFVFGADVTQQKLAERALRQSEKMATLGTLAAGVAHELNNPAAATRRAADQLRAAFAALESAHLALSPHSLSAEARGLIERMDTQSRERATTARDLDPMARSDREADIEQWIEEHALDDAMSLAGPLATQGLTRTELDGFVDAFPPECIAPALTLVANAFQVYALLYEIGNGSARISEIVGALRSYSYLGQAPVQYIDVHEGIDNTLVILRSKLKTGVTVAREYASELPRIPAYGSELNQVWTNLIDNAVDAMAGKGQIVIRTRRDGEYIAVDVEDNGSGIPPDAQSRVFDPFFTTKAPGKGTGLGLSTSYSIVTEKHGGRISVDSRPGCTRFRVHLPLAAPTTAGRSPQSADATGNGAPTA